MIPAPDPRGPELLRLFGEAAEALRRGDFSLQAAPLKEGPSRTMRVRLAVCWRDSPLIDLGLTFLWLHDFRYVVDFLSLRCHECGDYPMPIYIAGAKFGSQCGAQVPADEVYVQTSLSRREVWSMDMVGERAKSMIETGFCLRGINVLTGAVWANEAWDLLLQGLGCAHPAYLLSQTLDGPGLDKIAKS